MRYVVLIALILVAILAGCLASRTEADGYRQAERLGNQMQLTPPPTTAPIFSSANDGRRCTGAVALLAYYSPGWDVARMSGIMYRESRCQPGASNRCCHGLLQIHESWCGYLGRNLGPCNLYDPIYNIRAARLVWLEQGYPAWSTS